MRSAAVAQQQAGSSSFLILEIDLNYFIFTARSRLARPSCPFYDRQGAHSAWARDRVSSVSNTPTQLGC